jgi:hypothetical protein
VVEGVRRAFRDHPKGESLGLHRNDPIACFIHANNVPRIAAFFVLLAFFIVPALLVASLDGTLASPTLRQDLAGDFSIALAKIARFVNVFTQTPDQTVAPAGETASGTRFVLLRDYTYLICMIAAPVVLGRIYGQWDRLSGIPANLRAKGCFRATLSDGEYQEVLATFRSAVGSPLLNVGALLAATAMVAIIYRQISLDGLYSILNPHPGSVASDDMAWELHAYAGWWARPVPGDLLSYVAFAMVVVDWTVIIYYAFIDNFIGLIYLRTLWSIYRGRGEWRLFRIQPDDPDGWSGFGVVHDAEWDVIHLVGLYGLMIALGMCYVGLRGAAVLVVFFVMWVGFTLIYIWMPRGVFGTILRQHKAQQLEKFAARLKQARANLVEADVGVSPSSTEDGPPITVRPEEYSMVDSLYRTTAAMPVELLSIKSKVFFGTLASVLPIGSALLNFAQSNGKTNLGSVLSSILDFLGKSGS